MPPPSSSDRPAAAFQTVAEFESGGTVYAEGWQTWSPMRLHKPGEPSLPVPDRQTQVGLLRPDKPAPAGVIQAEGLLAVGGPDGNSGARVASGTEGDVPPP